MSNRNNEQQTNRGNSKNKFTLVLMLSTYNQLNLIKLSLS